MNSLQRCFAIILPSACFSFAAAAVEVYEGSLTAPNNAQQDTHFRLTLKYDLNPDNTITGILQVNPWGPCIKGDGRPISGVIEGGKLTFETAASELKGCGINRFRGVKKGDAWAGTISFQGGRREITLKKQ